MITRIHSSAVYVSNQDAAIAFYVNTLGFKLVSDMPMGEGTRWVTVVPPGAATELALLPIVWYDGQGDPHKSTGITFAVENIDGMYETLLGQGVKFKDPVSVMPWGDKATWFYDPDGNAFFIVETP